MKKNVMWNAIGSMFNAFNSLFFLVLVTRINGVEAAGLFTFAFSTACLFYVIGTYSGRIFQVTDTDKNNDINYFYSKIITCFIMIVTTVLFCILRGYSIDKFIIIFILCIFKMLEAFSESLYAIIQRNELLYKVGFSMFIKSLLSILLFFIYNFFSKDLTISSLLIVVSNLIVIIFYDIPCVRKCNFKLSKFKFDKVFEVLKNGFYVFGFTFLSLYVINAAKYSIDSVLNDSSQTIFGIIAMPATIMILLSQFVIQPYLNKMVEINKEGNEKFKLFIFKLSFMVVLLGIFVFIVSSFLGISLLELLYGISLSNYKFGLQIIIIGAIFYGVSTVISAGLTTLRSTSSQLIIYLVASLVSFILSHFLVKEYQLYGAFYSYAISMFLLLIMYYIVFTYELKNKSAKF